MGRNDFTPLKPLQVDMADDHPIIAEYIRFRESVQHEADVLFTRFNVYISCLKGCTACCYIDLHMRALELFMLVRRLRPLAPELKARILREMERPVETVQKEIGKERYDIFERVNYNFENPCPFLIDRCCLLYSDRPIICRVWGLPIYLHREDIDMQRCLQQFKKKTLCPLNFRHTINAAALPKHLCIDQDANLERLDELNDRFVREINMDRKVFVMRHSIRLLLQNEP